MRRAIVIVTVTAVHVEDGGHFIDGEIEPIGEPLTARVASPYPGAYFPVAVGSEWIVALPQGEGATEPIALAPLWSAAEPPPAEAVADPTSVWIKSSGKVQVYGSETHLGGPNLLPEAGVVQGEAVDTFTGATFFVLGSASAVVRAKK